MEKRILSTKQEALGKIRTPGRKRVQPALSTRGKRVQEGLPSKKPLAFGMYDQQDALRVLQQKASRVRHPYPDHESTRGKAAKKSKMLSVISSSSTPFSGQQNVTWDVLVLPCSLNIKCLDTGDIVVGIKMVLTDIYHLSTWLALLVIALVLTIAMLASIARVRRLKVQEQSEAVQTVPAPVKEDSGTQNGIEASKRAK